MDAILGICFFMVVLMGLPLLLLLGDPESPRQISIDVDDDLGDSFTWTNEVTE